MTNINGFVSEIADLICEYVGTHALLVTSIQLPEQGVSERNRRIGGAVRLKGVFGECVNLYIGFLQTKKIHISRSGWIPEWDTILL